MSGTLLNDCRGWRSPLTSFSLADRSALDLHAREGASRARFSRPSSALLRVPVRAAVPLIARRPCPSLGPLPPARSLPPRSCRGPGVAFGAPSLRGVTHLSVTPRGTEREKQPPATAHKNPGSRDRSGGRQHGPTAQHPTQQAHERGGVRRARPLTMTARASGTRRPNTWTNGR